MPVLFVGDWRQLLPVVPRSVGHHHTLQKCSWWHYVTLLKLNYNWRCQQPRWDDGNDIAAQPEATLLRSVVRGEIPLSFEYCDVSRYREVRPIPLAGIRVEVRR